jgi:C-terminal processing protease CtpA/Prc
VLPVLLLALLLAACTNTANNGDNSAESEQGGEPTPSTVQPATDAADDSADGAGQAATDGVTGTVDAHQPVLMTGEFVYTNDIIADYYDQHAIALVDMYGFVIRDQEWEIPVESQTLGYLDMNEETRQGSYWLQLPALPAATFADVDQDGQEDRGVQIFAVAYWPNLTGGPYSVGDDRSRGWPSFLTSIITDRENQDEVIGGKLVVWAADDAQEFPTGFGDDALLFTEDDPVAPLPAGYSVVDLDEQPFAIIREAEPVATLYEPKDIAIKDFADLAYTEAFERMFNQVSTEYAFNDIDEKAPDWETLYDELAPRVEAAEADEDAEAFFLALQDFIAAFEDGHVYLDGGDLGTDFFIARAGGGYGLALRELDDGRVLVVFVLQGGPADEAGIEVGAEVLEFNGEPIDAAISAVEPLEGPYSTEFARRYDQVRYLVRAPVGDTATITFVQGAQETPQTAELEAVFEFESFFATSRFKDFRIDALPVEYTLRDSGVGYITINSNNDDLALIIQLFERALRLFEEEEVAGIIIDMRQNGGGAPLGMAGFLTDEAIVIGQSEYYSEETGQFEPEGPMGRIYPNENQYRFDTIVLLVGPSCFSACEEEAYGFSQVPDVTVLGHAPSAGVFAEVARGRYKLPEGMELQVPTGRTLMPDGSIFLEGEGVQPDERLPVTEESVLSDDEDVVLQAAEELILE